MRHEDPAHRAIDPHTGRAVWFLTRYDDCVGFLTDKRFGKEFRARLPAHLCDAGEAGEIHDIVNRHMLNLDDPNHARLKSLVHKAFMPGAINALRPRLEALADGLLEHIDTTVDEGEEFDLVERYAGVLPLLSLADMLGIPASDYAQFSAWTKAMLLVSDEAAVHVAVLEFSMYLHAQIEVRNQTQNPPDDLLTWMITAEDAGDRLTRQELLAMVFLLVTAGYETMVNFVSNSLRSLVEHPAQMQMLRDNLDNTVVVKSAIEELLRYNGPSYMTLPCWAFEDVELRGKVIRQGDTIHAVLHAANRDPAVFEFPDTFDILRHPNKHLAFSHGIHHCLGASLARLQGEIALTTLFRWMPDI